MITLSGKRILMALRWGKEIDVVEQGGEQVMTAYEHPYLMVRPLKQGTSSSAAIEISEHQRDTKKARCYWYQGEVKQTAVFNLENLLPIYPAGARRETQSRL